MRGSSLGAPRVGLDGVRVADSERVSFEAKQLRRVQIVGRVLHKELHEVVAAPASSFARREEAMNCLDEWAMDCLDEWLRGEATIWMLSCWP